MCTNQHACICRHIFKILGMHRLAYCTNWTITFKLILPNVPTIYVYMCYPNAGATTGAQTADAQ